MPQPCRLLEEISTFVRKEASRGFLNLLFTKDQRIARVERYYRRIGVSIESFQVSRHSFDTISQLTWTETTNLGTPEYPCMADEEQ